MDADARKLESEKQPEGMSARPCGPAPHQSSTRTGAQETGGLPVWSRLDAFLQEPDPFKALAIWLQGTDLVPGSCGRSKLQARLSRDIAQIDVLLTRQLNAILHHPALQRLEAGWLGLRYLVDQIEEGAPVKVRILNITHKELATDLERAIEFDHSQIFGKVYTDEFGMPGGEPYGLLIGDYEMRLRPDPQQPVRDMVMLSSLASVAAAAFAPFVTALHPSFLDLERFAELERPLNLARTFEQPDYLKWRALRSIEDARFLGLTMPRVLRRRPYTGLVFRGGFCFHEDVGAPHSDRHLWGTAVYALAAVVSRCFARSGWLADIRGVRRGETGGGVVTGLPIQSFATDRAGIAVKFPVDVIITDQLEKQTSELGLIPLTYCQDTEYLAFYSVPSVQQPKVYDKLPATTNARLSSMMQYILCTSRFAHYLKVIVRDKVGSHIGFEECESLLHRWLNQYTIPTETSDFETRMRCPLREAKVQVREHPGRPGSYVCVMHLAPHFQLDQLVTAMQLATELTPQGGSG
jgi:type VI secretion system ImpC/EvpB family protein